MEAESSLMHLQEPANSSCPGHSNTVHASPSHFLKSQFNNSYLLRLGLPSGRFALGLTTETKPYIHLSYLPYMPHARPIIFFFIWSPK